MKSHYFLIFQQDHDIISYEKDLPPILSTHSEGFIFEHGNLNLKHGNFQIKLEGEREECYTMLRGRGNEAFFWFFLLAFCAFFFAFFFLKNFTYFFLHVELIHFYFMETDSQNNPIHTSSTNLVSSLCVVSVALAVAPQKSELIIRNAEVRENLFRCIFFGFFFNSKII